MIIWTFAFNLIVVGNLKTVSIMANIKLLFQGTERSETVDDELEVYANSYNELTIVLNGSHLTMICLDKETAIKFSKEIRKQISYLESEVDNG